MGVRSFSQISFCTRANSPSVTEEVQDYILYYQCKGVLYEVHLIDSPGFDDGLVSDARVLKRIADYVNTIFKLKKKLAGVLYLHDITRAKMGGVGERNLRVLEKIIGKECYDNCTLVTTKWGCINNPQDELAREKTLSEKEKFFGGMLQSPQHARMERFHPKTKEKALEIITPYLEKKFTLHLSREMADPRGPKLALGDTEAGKVVADNVENMQKIAQTRQELARVQQAKEILAHRYDENLFAEFSQKRKTLRRKANMQRSARWVMRTTIVGGAIVATVLTLGPGAFAFALEPAFEKAVSTQRKAEKQAWKDLKADFVQKSQNSSALKDIDSNWISDKHVKHLDDLERYGLKNGGSDVDIMKVAQQGRFVGLATSESSETPLDLASLAMSESSEELESDAESLGSDIEKSSIMS